MSINIFFNTAKHGGSSVRSPVAPIASLSFFTRLVFYAFMASIPFDVVKILWLPDILQGNLSIPRIIGLVLSVAFLFDARLRPWKFPRALVWLGIFFLFYIAAVLRNDENSFISLFQQAQLLVLLFIVYNLFLTRRVTRGALFSFVVSSGFVAWLAIYERMSNIEFILVETRTSALGMDPNLYARILVYGVLCASGIIYIRREYGSLRKLVLWLLVGMMIYVIGQTASRGMTLSLVVGLITLGMYQGKSIWIKANKLLMTAAVLVITLWLFLRSEGLMDRWSVLIETGYMSQHDVIAAEAWRMALEHPMVGWGVTSSQMLAARLGIKGMMASAHNTPLTLLTTVGLYGTVPFYIGYFLVFSAAWRAKRGREMTIPLAIFMARIIMDITLGGLPEKMQCVFLAYQLASGHLVNADTRSNTAKMTGPRSG